MTQEGGGGKKLGEMTIQVGVASVKEEQSQEVEPDKPVRRQVGRGVYQ